MHHDVFKPLLLLFPIVDGECRCVEVRPFFYCLQSEDRVTSNKAYLHTNFICLLMRLLEDEIHHLPDLIGRHFVTVVFTRRRWICQSPPMRPRWEK